MGIKSLFFYFRNEGQAFLKFLQEAATGQPRDQEPQKQLTSATGNVASGK